MKAVLISIRPEWCEKIVNGEKTIEVRKSRPKLETPFKVYIYCTQGGDRLWLRDAAWRESWKNAPISFLCNAKSCGGMSLGNGSVVGEFVCDWIYQYSSADHLYGVDISHEDMARQSCLTRKQIEAYELKNAPEEGYGYFGVFGWHISALKIYDKPRKLNAFYKKCSEYTELSTNCFDCEYECGTDEVECDSEGRLYLHRAPQSWCYVEEQQ